MLETVYTDSMKTMTELAAAIEQATCLLMLRMWAAGLYSADGWTIMRISHAARSATDRSPVINLRPYNKITKKFYRAEK